MICPRTSMGKGRADSISGRSRAWAAPRAVYRTPVMRTRSPAASDSMSASLSGGETSLMPSAPSAITARAPCPCSQHDLLVPVRVAFDGHGHGEAGDVAGIAEDVDREGRRVAAVALGPDAEPVRAVEHLPLERVQCRVGIRAPQLAEQRALRQAGGHLEGAADPHAGDE